MDMEKLVCTYCKGTPVVAYMASYEPNEFDEPSEIIAACKDHIEVLDEYTAKKHPDLQAASESVSGEEFQKYLSEQDDDD